MFDSGVRLSYRSVGSVMIASVGLAACSADSPSNDLSAATQATPSAGSAAPALSNAGSTAAPMPGMSVMRPAAAGANAAVAGMGAAGAGGAAGIPINAGSAAPPSAGAGGAAAAPAMQPMAAGGGGTSGSPVSVATAGSGGVNGRDSTPAGEDECGPIPTMTLAGTTAGRVRGSGTIEYDVTPPNEWLSQRTVMRVPEEPPPSGTVFLWPGIQPLSAGKNFQPIGNGVLQPVLTWGPSCAPGNPGGHETWWISPVYVNVTSRDSAYRGCHGGPVIKVEPEHLLDLHIYLDAPNWVQKVVDLDSMKTTEYAHDMKGQAQARAFFVIELPDNAKPTEDIIFTKSVLTMAKSEPSACEPIARGMRDFASKARISADGKTCCIDRIALRAAGVDATTKDP